MNEEYTGLYCEKLVILLKEELTTSIHGEIKKFGLIG